MSYKRISGIYKITNIVNDKCYIGSSVSVFKRLNAHKGLLKNNKHFNKHLQSSFNKYGIEQFTFDILEEVLDINFINDREEYYIKINKSNDREIGYNKRIKCDTNIGRVFSESHKKNLSTSHMGKKRSKESNIKIIRSQYKPIYKLDGNGYILRKYESILHAHEDNLEIHKNNISMCCNNKINSTGGYNWCFISDYKDKKFKRVSKKSKKRLTFVYKNEETGDTFYKLKDVSDFLKIKYTTLHNMFSGLNKNKTNFIRYEIN
jgi:group I intron endonuclease